MKIKAIITGATGMVGKGVLLECLDHPEVESILVINRKPVGLSHPKLKEIVHKDFYNLSSIREQLGSYNTCYFCLGVSAMGMSETDYSKITHDLTLHFAQTLLELNPGMTFCYVSGSGTDSSEKGRMMWARVKGKTENTLLRMPFKASYMFRPGAIQPKKGIKSSTPLYNTIYTLFNPLLSFIKWISPNSITTTELVGKAMINVVDQGYEKKYLENGDINLVAGR